MSFVQFFRILWARRLVIIGATALCFLVAVAIGSFLPTRYTSTSRVMLDIVKPDPVTGQVMSSSFARTFFQTQAELIRDYRVTGAVVDDLGWTSSPQLRKQYENRNEADGRDFRRYLASIVAEGSKVNMVAGSNILEISYTGNNPETARIVADAIRKAYIDETLAFKRESAAQTAAWFDQQVIKVRDAVTAAETRKANFERTNDIILQDNNVDLESARLAALASAQQTQSAAALSVPMINAQALQLAQMDARITSAAETLGPNHPDLQDLRRQRAVMADAAATAGQVTPAAPVGGPSIAGQVKAQTARVLGQREKLEELRRLQADVLVLKDQYNKTAVKAADAHQQADSEDTGLTLLGSAIAPTEPVSPNWPMILIGSLALGAALGVVVSLTTELVSRRVRGIEDLSRTGVPVIAVLVPLREAALIPAKSRLLPSFR